MRVLAVLGHDSGPLCVGPHNARELADAYGTPLFVYNIEVARRRMSAVENAFGPRVRVLYSVKANPNVSVCQAFALAGAGAEVASAGEILVAIEAGFAGQDLMLAGPAKSPIDLQMAHDRSVGLISVESEHELDGVLAHDGPPLCLRVNLPVVARRGRPRLGHGSGKFGLDPDRALTLAAMCERRAPGRLVGLHVNQGTQRFDAAGWVDSARRLCELAAAVRRSTGAGIDLLNFGGGFGVPYCDRDPTFDLQLAGAGLQAVIRELPPTVRCHVELGRYLIAEAGVYLVRVVSIKRSRAGTFVFVDGGMHHHGAAAGVGSILRRPYPIVVCADPLAEPGPPARLVGPLCTAADELITDDSLPELKRGDVVAVLMSGAYGLTFSQTQFLGHPQPAEVVVDGPIRWLARDAGRPSDSLRGQRVRPAR